MRNYHIPFPKMDTWKDPSIWVALRYDVRVVLIIVEEKG